MRQAVPASLVLPLILLLAACGGQPATAIHLQLMAKPELNSEARVLSALDRIDIIFDAEDGFDNVPGAEAQLGPLVARDVDADGTLELVLEEPAQGDSFPLLRLLPGSNLGRSFSIRAVGWAGDREAAVGGATAVSFAEGESIDVTVPLDLCDAYLPPRVLYAVPGDGEQLDEEQARKLSSIRVYFSKLVDEASLEQHLRVTGPDGTLASSWRLHELETSCLGTASHSNLAILDIDDPCGLQGGTYHVEATSGVTDPEGEPLDQSALQQGSDPFISAFKVVRDYPWPCVGAGGPCTSDADCPPKERCDLDPTSPTFETCIRKDGTGGGSCGTCPGGYVCEVTATGPACVRDCREAGACVTGSCDPQTGLCR